MNLKEINLDEWELISATEWAHLEEDSLALTLNNKAFYFKKKQKSPFEEIRDLLVCGKFSWCALTQDVRNTIDEVVDICDKELEKGKEQ